MSAIVDVAAASPRRPWAIADLPNYDPTRTVLTSVDARDLTRASFADIVRASEPVIIRGAVAHWPAMHRWRDRASLLERIGADARVRQIDAPLVEVLGYAFGDTRQGTIEEEIAARQRKDVTWGEFLGSFDSAPAADIRYLYATTLDRPPFSALRADIVDFDYVTRTNAPTALGGYSEWRVFVGRGYTDWHYHPGSEAIMCQVVGTKRVALLPPDWETWRKMRRVARDCAFRYDVDLGRFPEFAAIAPISVDIGPGDAMFIPVHWWHCVESLTSELGFTAATAFDAAPRQAFDLRYPASYYTARIYVQYFRWWKNLTGRRRSRPSIREEPRGPA